MARYQIHPSELHSEFQAEMKCTQFRLPKGLGVGHSNIFQIDKGLSYIDTHYVPTKDISILSQLDDMSPKLVLTLGMNGESCFFNQDGSEVIFKKGYSTVTCFNSSNGERQYQEGKAMHQLRLTLNKSWLDRYIGSENSDLIFEKSKLQVLSHKPIAQQSLVIAQQLLTTANPAPMRHLFMHTQVMNLLMKELACLFQRYPAKCLADNQVDMQLANAARHILLTEFKSPPSIEVLSKRIGTNSFKLKKIFHQYFEMTPYGLLLEVRMQKAAQLLQSTQCNVSVAADFVGYSHASNFSSAFAKFYGVTPKEVARGYRIV